MYLNVTFVFVREGSCWFKKYFGFCFSVFACGVCMADFYLMNFREQLFWSVSCVLTEQVPMYSLTAASLTFLLFSNQSEIFYIDAGLFQIVVDPALIPV